MFTIKKEGKLVNHQKDHLQKAVRHNVTMHGTFVLMNIIGGIQEETSFRMLGRILSSQQMFKTDITSKKEKN